MSGVFITGTDTGVGKTRISCGFLQALAEQGLRVAGMKPVASGCERFAQGLRNDDALALQALTNIDCGYESINPYAFEPAIAPHLAAARVDVAIDPSLIKIRFEALAAAADRVVVEGAGGWHVPIDDSRSLADVARLLKLPVVLVVAIRLGCINHALLTARAIRADGLPLLGWVANCPQSGLLVNEQIGSLKKRLAAPLLGVVPPLEPSESAAAFLDSTPLLMLSSHFPGAAPLPD